MSNGKTMYVGDLGKVRIPKKVADAIEWYRNTEQEDDLYNINLLNTRSKGSGNHNADVIMSYLKSGGDNRRNYFSAIVKGYVIEKSPKQEVQDRIYEAGERYNNSDIASSDELIAQGELNAFRFIVRKLGIEGLDVR